MNSCYEVRFENEIVGKVQVLKEGLYVRIICRCLAPGNEIYRLYVLQNGRKESIGVLIPEEEGLILNKRVPSKRFGTDPVFMISSGDINLSGTFAPISPEEPFLYIHRLKSSFLQTENGRIGIRIEDPPETD